MTTATTPHTIPEQDHPWAQSGPHRIHRPTRRSYPPQPPVEPVVLLAPPELPEPQQQSLLRILMPIVMVVAMLGMMGVLFSSGARSPMALLFPMMMLFSVIGMFAGGAAGGTDLDVQRRDYLRYLHHLAETVTDTAQLQRAAAAHAHPEPGHLWTLVGTPRLWERGREDVDCGAIRIGRGRQRLATALKAPEIPNEDDSEPVSAGALRRFIRAHSHVDDVPVALALSAFRWLTISGDHRTSRDFLRAFLAHSVTLHGPELIRIALACRDDEQWKALKWLPHHRAEGTDQPLRARSLAELEDYLGGELARRATAPHHQPLLLIIIDDADTAGAAQLLSGSGPEGVIVLDLSDSPQRLDRLHSAPGLHVHCADGTLFAHTDVGAEPLCAHDVLSDTEFTQLARLIAGYRRPAVDASGGPSTHSVDNKLFRLLGMGEVEDFQPPQSWQEDRGAHRLKVPLGVRADGAPLYLDLKEAAHGGVGPHGLCIGATGSGKSELLRTLVLSLIVTHSPQSLNLVLVDFKGGATFAGVEKAPHVSAMITNLGEELPLVNRMRDALTGEMNRRQELLRAAGNYASVTDYELARRRGADLEPLPALVIIIDEFSELLAQKPEFIDIFVAIGRLGRSLHMHLLLASQRLEEGRLRGLDSHLSYRIGLKTFSAAESRSVLGVPDAYELPSQPGAGYMKTDAGSPQRFHAAYVSGPHLPRTLSQESGIADASPRSAQIELFGVLPQREEETLDSVPDTVEEIDESLPSELDVAIAKMASLPTAAHQVWLPPLPLSYPIGQIVQENPQVAASPGALMVAVGVVDVPYHQRRDPLILDLSGGGGHVAIIGGPRSGKTTALRSLAVSLAATYPSSQVALYVLDLSGGLGDLAQLNHVGTVGGRGNPDVVRRIVAHLKHQLAWRIDNPGAAPWPQLMVLVDGWHVLRSDFDGLEEQLGELIVDGLAVGIHLCVTANRWSAIRPALKDLFGTRLELKLGDPMDSIVSRHVAADVPADRPGRGLHPSGHHVLIGQSSGEDIAHVCALTAEQPQVEQVKLLPAVVDYPALTAALPASASAAIVIGLAESTLQPVEVSTHLVYCSAHGTGRSTCARVYLAEVERTQAVRSAEHQPKILVIDYRRGLLGITAPELLAGYASSAGTAATMVAELVAYLKARLPGPDITPAQLKARSWWSGPEIHIVVDDYDLVTAAGANPLLPLAELLPHARDIGLHMALMRSSTALARASFDPIIQGLKDGGAVMLIGTVDRDEGPVFGLKPATLPSGRAQLLTRSGKDLVQLAWMEEPDEGADAEDTVVTGGTDDTDDTDPAVVPPDHSDHPEPAAAATTVAAPSSDTSDSDTQQRRHRQAHRTAGEAVRREAPSTPPVTGSVVIPQRARRV